MKGFKRGVHCRSHNITDPLFGKPTQNSVEISRSASTLCNHDPDLACQTVLVPDGEWAANVATIAGDEIGITTGTHFPKHQKDLAPGLLKCGYQSFIIVLICNKHLVAFFQQGASPACKASRADNVRERCGSAPPYT